MQEILNSILAQIDTKTLIIIAVVLVILAIIAIVKKIVKLGITILVLTLVVTCFIPMAKDFQSKYQLSIEDGVATIVVEGKEITLDKVNCKSLRMEADEDGVYHLEADTENGIIEIDVPKFMVSGIEAFAEKNGIMASTKD